MVAPAVSAALISGGASLLGGLFGRKKPQTQTSTTTYDFKQLRDSAQEAGFNPLTALRATGGGGTTTTTLPSVSSLEAVGNAIQAGVGTYLAYDPVEQETKELENEILKEELSRLRGMPVVQTTQSPVTRQTAPPLSEIRPKYRPSFEQAKSQMIPVWTMDGERARVPKDANIEPFAVVSRGVVSEVAGEVIGEGKAVVGSKNTADAMELPWIGNPFGKPGDENPEPFFDFTTPSTGSAGRRK